MNSVLSYIFNTIEIVVLVFVLVRAYPLLNRGAATATLAFLMFGMAAFLTCDLYWLVHMLLKPGIRLPLTAADIGENGCFLLFASALAAATKEKRRVSAAEIIGAVFFTAANIALWIAWSGEWIKDIFGGILYGYFVLAAVRSLRQTGCLSKSKWACLIALCAVLLLLQGAYLLLPRSIAAVTDKICYVLMFAGAVFFLKESVAAHVRNAEPGVYMALSFASYCWNVCILYMSSEPMYFAAMLLCSISLLLMYKATRREVLSA